MDSITQNEKLPQSNCISNDSQFSQNQKHQEKGKLFLKFGEELEEAKYTNIHNKIKNIRNLKRKESEFIANIDPAVMGQVVKALAPMFGLKEEMMPGKGNVHAFMSNSLQISPGIPKTRNRPKNGYKLDNNKQLQSQ